MIHQDCMAMDVTVLWVIWHFDLSHMANQRTSLTEVAVLTRYLKYFIFQIKKIYFQDCLKCAKEEHGDTCIPDNLGYKYGFKVGGNEIVCENSPKSCRRSLCECDKMFAKMQAANYEKFDSNLSVQLSTWEPEDQCIRGKFHFPWFSHKTRD